MAKFQFFGGEYSGVKTENTQSAKKWLNFNFFGGGRYSKCQEMALEYSGKTENTQSAKKWLNFNFLGGSTLESKLKILKVPRNG